MTSMELTIRSERLVNDLLDHYQPDQASPNRILRGSHFELLGDARRQSQEFLRVYFGLEEELPLEATYADYTMSREEAVRARSVLREPAIAMFGAQVATDMYQLHDAVQRLSAEGAAVRRSVFSQALDMDYTQPRLEISTALEAVDHVDTGHSTGCVMNTFGGNVERILLPGAAIEGGLDGSGLRLALENHSVARAYGLAKHDLTWLLGMLETDYARDISGHSVRTVTTIGADLGEIQDKIMTPLRSRDPSVRFIINALMASEKSRTANHSVTILASDGRTVSVSDSNWKGVPVRRVDSRSFWKAWAKANLQAIVTIFQPVQ